MDDGKIYEMIMNLSKESTEHDARVETRMEDFDRRLDKLEKQQEETQQILNATASMLKRVDDKLNNDWGKFQNINHELEQRKAANEKQSKICEDRFRALEDGPKNFVWSGVKKFVTIFLTVLATALVTYFITKLGLK